MTKDIIIVVPKGTRVRYIESEYVDQIYAVDVEKLNAPITFQSYDSSSLSGIPVYEAETYSRIPEHLLERARKKAEEENV